MSEQNEAYEPVKKPQHSKNLTHVPGCCHGEPGSNPKSFKSQPVSFCYHGEQPVIESAMIDNTPSLFRFY